MASRPAVLLGAFLWTSSALAQWQQPPPNNGQPPPNNGQPLAPPPPMGTAPTTTQPTTTQNLDAAKAQDSGRGLELFYAQFEPIGFGFFSLGAISDKLGLTETAHAGANIGLGAGVRYLIFTFGARF